MYLGELNKEQKDYFLDLGINLALMDGDFSETERNAIHLLCDEMHIEDRYEVVHSSDEAIAFFTSNADSYVQRIIVFELLGIAMADSVYEEHEHELVLSVAKAFKIGENEIKAISDTIMQLYSLYGKISLFIGEQS